MASLSVSSYSQVVNGRQYNYVGNWYNWQGGIFKNNLNPPKLRATTGLDSGALSYNTVTRKIDYWDGDSWKELGGGTGADSSIYATRYWATQNFSPFYFTKNGTTLYPTSGEKIAFGGTTASADLHHYAGTSSWAGIIQPSNYLTTYGVQFGNDVGTAQRFYYGGSQTFNGVNQTTRPNVVARMFGYNSTLGGGRLSNTDAGFHFGAETYYQIYGQFDPGWMEFHLPEFYSIDGRSTRIHSMYISRANGGGFFETVIPQHFYYYNRGIGNRYLYLSILGDSTTGSNINLSTLTGIGGYNMKYTLNNNTDLGAASVQLAHGDNNVLNLTATNTVSKQNRIALNTQTVDFPFSNGGLKKIVIRNNGQIISNGSMLIGTPGFPDGVSIDNAIDAGSWETAAASAVIDMRSTSKGFLPPRMTGAQMNAIASPAIGLFVYNTDSAAYCFYNGAWTKVGAATGGGAVSSVFGRTGAVTALEADYSSFYPVLSGSYNNPSWINQLAWSKITGAPAFITNIPTDSSTSINNRILARYPSDTSLSIGNRFLGKQDALGFTPVPNTRTLTINGTTFDLTANRTWTIPTFSSDTSLSIGNRFLSVNNQISYINTRLDSVKVVEIDKTLDSFAWVKPTGELKIKSARVTAGSSKVSVTGSGTDSTRQWSVDVTEANLTLNNIGGTLDNTKLTTNPLSRSNHTGTQTASTISDFTSTARGSISLTTTGTSGAATYNSSTGVLNIPQYTGSGSSTTTTDNNLDITSGVLTMRKTPLTLTDGATITWNAATGYNARVVLGGNRTLSITNPQAGQFGTLTVVQDATGSRRLTVPNGSVIVTPVPNDSTVIQWWYENGAFKWSAPEIGGTVFMPSDVANSNSTANTMADLTGLSFPVYSGYLYEFEFFIPYSAAATTTGSRWAVNGPTTTYLGYKSYYTLTATTETINYADAYDIPAASNATSLTTGNIATIKGAIRPSANGTLIGRFASEVSASAITALGTYSYVKWKIINQY